MSYPPSSNYYGATSSNQNDQRRYASHEGSTTQSSTYHTQAHGTEHDHRSQYNTNQYRWVGQSQPANLSHSQIGYANEPWQDRSSISNTCSYQRELYQQNETAGSNNHVYQSRDPYNSQNTQGLNHLAYASGLEPAASSHPTGRKPQPQATVSYNSAMPSISQLRTNPPDTGNGLYSTGQSQSLSSAPYSSTNTSVPFPKVSQDLALDAAAVLAGAARSRIALSSQQSGSLTTRRTTNSSMSNSNQPTTESSGQTKASPYSVDPPSSQHKRNPSANAQVVNVNTDTMPRATTKDRIKNLPSGEQQRVSQSTQPITDNKTTNTMVESTIQPALPPNNPQSIANLVSNTDDSDQSVLESIETLVVMPNFIDPTQVFNPYHKEHERKKREAAEADARRKAGEARMAEENQRAASEAVKKVTESSTTANSKSKITKKSNTTKSVGNAQDASQIQAEATNRSPGEALMATEMQQMMAKVKEFRSSNPSLFAKLWNDMRGAGTSTVTAVPAATQTPSPNVAQASLTRNSVKSTIADQTRSKMADKNTKPVSRPLNGYKLVVEDNPEGHPDLGRFPAERRTKVTLSKDASKPSIAIQQHSVNTGTPSLPAPEVSTTPASTVAHYTDSNVPWPEPRRRAVATAAIHILALNPENASVTITVQDICTLLEHNPSYLDLCTTLEARGMKFQRTIFAKELLKRVPELQTPIIIKSSTSTKKEIGPRLDMAQNGTFSSVAIQPQPNSLPSNASENHPKIHRELQTAPGLTHNVTVFSGSATGKTEVPRPSSKQPARTSRGKVSHSGRLEPPAGSKEAAARKRDFSELIDLTEIEDDENYVLPPAKQPKLGAEVAINLHKPPEAGIISTFVPINSEPLRFNPQAATQSRPSQFIYPSVLGRPPTAYSIPQSEGRSIYPSRIDPWAATCEQTSDNKPRMILAKKLEKADALQKSYYDPRTVARDILIACGRHPSERPLNLHLAGLIGSFIELDSDVATFDWDSIDPGGPPPAKVEYTQIPAAPPKFRLGDRARKKVRMAGVENSRTPELDTRSNARTIGPTSAATMHFPSSLAAPSIKHPTPSSNNLNLNDRNEFLQKLARRANHTTERSTPTAQKISIDLPPVTSPPRQSSVSTPNRTSNLIAKMEDGTPQTTKRRGRPPGAKNKNPSIAAMKQQAKATMIEATPETAPEPILHNYKCRWIRCHTELHNLDILRRHVQKRHLQDEELAKESGYICWWKKCQFLRPDGDGHLDPSRQFESCEELMSHVEEDHIGPIAQKYGDGPKTTHTDPQSLEAARQRWLTDSNHRATTPLVTPDGNSEHPHDAMVLIKTYPQGPKNEKEKADITAQNAFMKAHGNKHKDGRKAAEEVVRAMEVRKQRIGPGIDRGGCTLINEARRNGFIQAPGISRVVDYEY